MNLSCMFCLESYLNLLEFSWRTALGHLLILKMRLVGDLSILFALGCDKHFIPITRVADDEIEDLLEQCECMTEIATVVVFILIVG